MAVRHLATIHNVHGDESWVIAESPAEALALINAAGQQEMVTFTLANPCAESGAEWNGRDVHIRRDTIAAISPPLDLDD
jgi:hypothetical protein